MYVNVKDRCVIVAGWKKSCMLMSKITAFLLLVARAMPVHVISSMHISFLAGKIPDESDSKLCVSDH